MKKFDFNSLSEESTKRINSHSIHLHEKYAKIYAKSDSLENINSRESHTTV